MVEKEYAKAIFEYDDSQLHDIEKTSNPNEYKLNTGLTLQQVLL